MANEFTNAKNIEDSLKGILDFIGDDSNREGLIETPARIRKSWDTLFSGYNEDPHDHLKTFEDGACDEMVIVKDLEFFSTCEHHMLPFFGKMSIAYLPAGKVLGVSKVIRIAEVFTRRLQIQERLGQQIGEFLYKELNAEGAIVVCEAQHLCMVARGVKNQNAKMVTSAVFGAFKDNPETRNEFLQLIK